MEGGRERSWEGGANSEVGPVVVLKERDYAAARMRKWEKKQSAESIAHSWKDRRWESEKVGKTGILA
jgi:hypothetical protein